ncbi:MAG: hypothetical protein IT452_04260 [Planctomycetia bacterium]|nr:hypothetical protein [Planctomycetia bacterium]
MRINSKFPGSCASCATEWPEGAEVEWRRGCSPICLACSAAGKAPPPKDGAPSKNPAIVSPASAPGGSDLRALTEAANRIEKVLAQILTELRTARRPASAQNAPPPEVSAIDSEVPF